MPRRYWLMKTEPLAYSIDDLARDGTTDWEGVRNYQARNLLRDQLKVGDRVLIYHSSVIPAGVAGLADVSRHAFPDTTAFDRRSPYFDAKSDADRPTWYAVGVSFVEKFAGPVTLEEIRAHPRLAGMMVARRGMRLSVQPVQRPHYLLICRLGRRKGGSR